MGERQLIFWAISARLCLSRPPYSLGAGSVFAVLWPKKRKGQQKLPAPPDVDLGQACFFGTRSPERSTFSVRLIPSGVSSNAHARTSAIGKPITTGESPTAPPKLEFPGSGKPGSRLGPGASRQSHTRSRPCKRCAALARRRSSCVGLAVRSAHFNWSSARPIVRKNASQRGSS